MLWEQSNKQVLNPTEGDFSFDYTHVIHQNYTQYNATSISDLKFFEVNCELNQLEKLEPTRKSCFFVACSRISVQTVFGRLATRLLYTKVFCLVGWFFLPGTIFHLMISCYCSEQKLTRDYTE